MGNGDRTDIDAVTFEPADQTTDAVIRTLHRSDGVGVGDVAFRQPTDQTTDVIPTVDAAGKVGTFDDSRTPGTAHETAVPTAAGSVDGPVEGRVGNGGVLRFTHQAPMTALGAGDGHCSRTVNRVDRRSDREPHQTGCRVSARHCRFEFEILDHGAVGVRDKSRSTTRDLQSGDRVSATVVRSREGS